MQAMIRTDALSFSYPVEEGQRRTTALEDVTLSIEKGSFVVVLGHNGSGKSTLAKHFNAVLLPSGGAVYVEGMNTQDEDLLLEIRRRVGMVFQNPDNQIVANVVEEDVAFAPENLGVPTAEIRRRVDDALAAVGMTEFARRTCCPADRSSGWPSPGSSPWSRNASCWTRPRPCWTLPDAGRCWTPSTG